MERIYVPSKGRPYNCTFVQKLIEQNVHFYLVVEPQDYESYMSMLDDQPYLNAPKILVLPKDNQGIAYVRNYIKIHAYGDGLCYFWMFDDDISRILKREGTKMIQAPIKEVLEQAEHQLIKSVPYLAIGALEYTQFAWSATKPLVTDSFCDSAVLINTKATKPIMYRGYLEGKEDRDFAMQCIMAGFKTARTTLYAFAAPANGSNKGGLKETFYDVQGREKICAERMVEIWGDRIVQVVTKPNGRIDAKINWKEINSTQQSLF